MRLCFEKKKRTTPSQENKPLLFLSPLMHFFFFCSRGHGSGSDKKLKGNDESRVTLPSFHSHKSTKRKESGFSPEFTSSRSYPDQSGDLAGRPESADALPGRRNADGCLTDLDVSA